MKTTVIFTPFLFFYYIYSVIGAIETLPSCTKCKWFVPHKLGVEDYGLCKLHKNTYSLRKNMEVSIYEYAKHCRDNQNMCGKEGYLYDEASDDDNEYQYQNQNVNMSHDDDDAKKDEDIRKTLKMIEKFNKRRYYTET